MDQGRRDFFESFNILKDSKKKKEKKGTSLIINNDLCLSWKQTMCFSCKDICNDEAIDFLGMFKPVINDSCTKCNDCIGVCPVKAIVLI